MKTMNILLTTVILGLGSVSAIASSVEGANLYKKCAGCHGMTGEKKALGKSKVISDMSNKEIVTALKGYKDGTYGGQMKGLMKGQVMKLNDKDVQDISDHISKK